MDSICWFMFVGRPKPDAADGPDVAGAYVNAWVANADIAIAEQIARDAIEDEHWTIEGLEDQLVVSRSYYKDLPESLEYYEQAVRDGYCLVFNTWPPEGEND